jgi:integral membrane protein
LKHSDTIDTPSGKARGAVRSLNRLRLVGWLEGISYLVLLGIAMPLKYLAGMPEGVKVVGWAHGVLFILFVAAVADVTLTTRWPWKRAFGAFIASLIPFGTFVLDARLRRDVEAIATPALPLAPGR